MASAAAVFTGREIPGAERLPVAMQDLSTLKEEIFGKWNTLEELEQMLVDSYPLSAEQFDVLATKYRPPQEWYLQEGQPF